MDPEAAAVHDVQSVKNVQSVPTVKSVPNVIQSVQSQGQELDEIPRFHTPIYRAHENRTKSLAQLTVGLMIE